MDITKATFLVILLHVQALASRRASKTQESSLPASAPCLVIAPREFQLDQEESVWITVPRSNHRNILVELLFDNGNRNFGRIETNLPSSDTSKRVAITLRTRDVAGLNSQSNLKFVARCNHKEVARKPAKIISSKLTVLIQTDKPIYTPKQHVLARIYTLDRNLLPIDTPFHVDIINPQGVIVQRDSNPPGPDDDVNSNNVPGLIHTKFTFPPFPMFGEWQIMVNYGKNFGLKEKSTFVVEEYELPKFSVDLDLDVDVIFPSTSDLNMEITARYVFGGFVKGSAFCKFGILSKDRLIMFRSLSIDEFDGSDQSVTIQMRWVKDMMWFPNIEGSRLMIECNVTDSSTIKKVTVVNREAIFSRSPYTVNFHKSQGYFKPGLPYFLQADISHVNGQSAPALDVTVLVADNAGHNLPGTAKMVRTDAWGSLVLAVDMQSQPGDRILKVKIDGYVDRVFEHVLERDDTIGGRFISVTPKSNKMPLQEGDNIQLQVHASHPNEVDLLHHLVTSKGMVHYHATSRFSQGRPISLHIAREYVPVVNVVVFYSSPVAGMVSDTVSLEVEYNCDSKERFTTDKARYLPGDEMTVSMSGSPQTQFALMAVDHSVYLLRNRSRLTTQKMLRVLHRDTGKQSKLSSSDDALEETNVNVLGSNRAHAIARLRMLQNRKRGSFRGHRRRVARAAESGDVALSDEWYDNSGYYDDYGSLYENFGQYEEDVEEQDDDPAIRRLELDLVEEDALLEEAGEDELTLEQCCERAANHSGVSCKASAMNLTVFTAATPECIRTFYNCCVQQASKKEGNKEMNDGDDGGAAGAGQPRHLGMSHSSHASRSHHKVYYKRRYMRIHHTQSRLQKLNPKYRTMRLFKEAIRFVDMGDKDIFEISMASQTGVVRRYFPESWMFDVHHIGSHSNSRRIIKHIPDTITTWDLQAVTLHPHTGLCVLDTRSVKVAKDIFMLVEFPYEATRLEQLEVKVTIHNKARLRITTNVYMVGVNGVCSNARAGDRSKKVTISLHPGTSEHVSWAIKPVAVGTFNLRFELHARPYDRHNEDPTLVDAVIKNLHVSAEGVPRIRNLGSYLLDPMNLVSSGADSIGNGIHRESVSLTVPRDAIPGSVEALIKIQGDIMGPAVHSIVGRLNRLIRQPVASGEQTMMNLGPVLYTAKYLKKSNQLSVRDRRQAKKKIRDGVQHMLTFRKKDGSYAIWTQSKSSTWLTAFVLKVFHDSQDFGALNKDPSKLLCSAANWLAKHQNADGSFRELAPFTSHQVASSSDVEGMVALTAFTIVSLNSVDCGHAGVIGKGQQYLRGELNSLQFKPYPLALVTYAFSLTRDSMLQRAADLLWHDRIMRCYTNKGVCYWPADRSDLRQPSWYKEPKALEIETASYALLSFVEQKNYVKANKIAKWLAEQRNDRGGFVSTQDTMLGLESLALFATKTRRQGIDLQCVLSSSKNRNWRENIHIDQHNALEQHHIEVTNHVDGDLHLTSRGTGVGHAHIYLKYHSAQNDSVNSCKFDLSVETKEQNLDWEDLLGNVGRRRRSARTKVKHRSRRLTASSYNVIELTTCIRYLDQQPTGLAMLEVGLYTGFEPIASQLKELQREPSNHIGRFEIHKRAVQFYFDHVPNRGRTCLEFDVRQVHKVGYTQPVAVTVYDLNEPSARCTKFYHPSMNSELLKSSCRGNGECTCRDNS